MGVEGWAPHPAQIGKSRACSGSKREIPGGRGDWRSACRTSLFCSSAASGGWRYYSTRFYIVKACVVWMTAWERGARHGRIGGVLRRAEKLVVRWLPDCGSSSGFVRAFPGLASVFGCRHAVVAPLSSRLPARVVWSAPVRDVWWQPACVRPTILTT